MGLVATDNECGGELETLVYWTGLRERGRLAGGLRVLGQLAGMLELDGSRQDGIHGRRLGGWGDRVR